MSTPSPWRYFSMEELTCRCGCERMEMDSQFMSRIVAMREAVGFSFPVTSGYRCPDYNAAISSTGLDGPHTTGKALDIGVDRQTAYKLLKSAFERGFTGIGVKQKGRSRFIHIDGLEEGLRPTVWSY